MESDYKNILLQLCASLTRVDHMGAAWENIAIALQKAGVNINNATSTEIAKVLGEMEVTTFDGSALSGGYEPYYS